MIVQYRQYDVEIINDTDYTPGSSNNISRYANEYIDDVHHRPSSKTGIRILQERNEISSAIIFGYGGGTTVHKNSFVTIEDSLLLCCGNAIYSLSLPQLQKQWHIVADAATCFGVHQFEDDFIIHGETEISRIDKSGNIKWQFSGRDIFVSLGKEDRRC